MGNVSEGNAAIKGLHGKDKGGRKLTVNEVRPKDDRGGHSSPGSRRQFPSSSLSALAFEQLFPVFVGEVCHFFSRRHNWRFLSDTFETVQDAP
jgi:hypothetical protein